MLDNLFAQKLAKRIMQQLGYNINIMNEKGIIIASGDSKRIGDFHESAYRIIKNGLDIEIVREEDLESIGVKPGVNMSIIYENQIIGVIGISGDPDEIMNFSHIVKLSVEVMIEYELYKDEVQKRQYNKDEFLNALLYEEPINSDKLLKLAKNLQYDCELFRIPIYIKLLTRKESKPIINSIVSCNYNTKQDIPMPLTYESVLVFKTIPVNMLKSYKKVVLGYIKSIDTLFENYPEKFQCHYYIGTIQDNFENYRKAYQHCTWLAKSQYTKNASVSFFLDHMFEYFGELLNAEFYEPIFSIYSSIVENIGKDIFIETVTALYENNMNINDAAVQLYLHRNTVAFRLNKIKKDLGIDPFKNIFDRQFMFYLLYYIRNSD